MRPVSGGAASSAVLNIRVPSESCAGSVAHVAAGSRGSVTSRGSPVAGCAEAAAAAAVPGPVVSAAGLAEGPERDGQSGQQQRGYGGDTRRQSANGHRWMVSHI